MNERIQRSRDDRTLSGREARDAMRTLNDIRRQERDLAGDGSFFSQVDMRVNESMWQIARERVGFFEERARKFTGGQHTYDQVLEGIRLCQAQKSARATGIAAYFAKQ
jgi:hypothetical protein